MADKIPPQNLIRQINPEAPTRQPRFYKAFAFDVISVAAAAAAGFFYLRYLNGESTLAPALAAIGGFMAISTLQVFTAKDLVRRFFVMVLEAAAFLGLYVFAGHDWRLLLAAAVVFLVFSFWGTLSGQRELENTLEIKFFKAARPHLKKFTTALLIVMIILFAPSLDEGKVFVSEQSFDQFYGWLAGVARAVYPTVKFNTTFGELARGVARLQLQSNQAFQGLPPQEQQNVLNRTADEVARRFSESLGVEISPETSTGSIFYNLITQTLEGWMDRFGSIFFFGWGIAIFLVLRGLGAIFHLLIAFFTFVIYQILLASGFLHIIGETRTHELVEW